MKSVPAPATWKAAPFTPKKQRENTSLVVRSRP
jgi:hypothetical protein